MKPWGSISTLIVGTLWALAAFTTGHVVIGALILWVSMVPASKLLDDLVEEDRLLDERMLDGEDDDET